MSRIWAIHPDALGPIVAAIKAGRPADLPPGPVKAGLFGTVTIEADAEERPYQLTPDGTAIIPLVGPLFADTAAWWLVWIMGGTTYGHLVHCLTRASEDTLVQRIVLDIDSPGGMVTGLAEAAAKMAELAQVKPITAYARGLCASAAYWLASQCTEVVAAPTAPAGCMGVRIDAYVYDRMYSEAGIDHIVITSDDTPRKAPDLTTESGQADLRRQCNVVFDAFVAAVSAGRGVDETWVRESMGQGAVLVGPDALAARLIDRIAIGPEAACQHSEGEGEAVVDLPPDESSPTPGAAGHTPEVSMAEKANPAAQQQAANDAQLAALTAERDALKAANEALGARVAEYEAAAKAAQDQARIAARDAALDAEAKRVGKSYPRAQFQALADQIGTEAAMAISATYPAAGGLPTKLAGQEVGVETPKTRAELHDFIAAQAKSWGVDYTAAYARLGQERPDLFQNGGEA